MLCLVLSSYLAASPATGLAVASQLGKGGAPAASWLDAIEQELLTQLPIKRLALSCDGDRGCLQRGAREAGVPGLVAVTIASGKKQTTLDLEALRTSDGTTVGQLTFTVLGTRLTAADKEGIRALGAKLAAALTVPAPAPADKPVVEPPPPALVTKDPPPALDLTTPAPKAVRPRLPGWLFVGTGIAAALASGALLVVAEGERADLAARTSASPSELTRAQAETRAQDANTLYTASLGAGIAGAALVTTGALWLGLPE